MAGSCYIDDQKRSIAYIRKEEECSLCYFTPPHTLQIPSVHHLLSLSSLLLLLLFSFFWREELKGNFSKIEKKKSCFLVHISTIYTHNSSQVNAAALRAVAFLAFHNGRPRGEERVHEKYWAAPIYLDAFYTTAAAAAATTTGEEGGRTCFFFFLRFFSFYIWINQSRVSL